VEYFEGDPSQPAVLSIQERLQYSHRDNFIATPGSPSESPFVVPLWHKTRHLRFAHGHNEVPMRSSNMSSQRNAAKCGSIVGAHSIYVSNGNNKSRDSSVGVVTRLWNGRMWF
jgi:hypothetical protein